MGITEYFTHKEEIEELLNSAQLMYDQATSDFENQKQKTTKSLENLGKVKLDCWSNDMEKYIELFQFFNNIEVEKIDDGDTWFLGSNETPETMLINIKDASLKANEVVKAGVSSLGTGALVGIASYGGAMMFGSASTGTAISDLSGAAKKNATLAWFGGGSKSSGGFGMQGGAIVLAGITVASIAAVAAAIAGAKGKEKLAEAKKVYAQAENAAADMRVMITGMKGISKMSDNYLFFIKQVRRKYIPFLNEVEKIKNKYSSDDSPYIDYNVLTPVEQKTLHLSWLMTQIYYKVLSANIVNSDGAVELEAQEIINTSKKELKQIEKEASALKGNEISIRKITWKDKSELIYFAGLFVSILMMYICAYSRHQSTLVRMVAFICSIISFPFNNRKNLSTDELYSSRFTKIIAAIIIYFVFYILF